jgi:hypothetical protein
MSHIYSEVKPTSRRDRDLNRLGLGFRLPYLADLGTKSPKIKTAKGSTPPQSEGPDFGEPFTQVPRARARRGEAWRARACGVYLPSPSHSSKEWR